jgi:predicted dehydrogenase
MGPDAGGSGRFAAIPREPIKVGVVGLGKMGISHCSIIGAHPDAVLAGVCDGSPLLRALFRQHTSVPVYSSVAAMLKEEAFDCIYIAVPTALHAEMVNRAIDDGVHVFCEKPFVLGSQNGEEIVKRVEQSGLVNQVGYHNRFIATFEHAKELIGQGVIGAPYHFHAESSGPVVVRRRGATWRSDSAKGGGCLYDYASHTIDLTHYLLNPTQAVRGTLLKSIYSNGVEDAVYSALTLVDGLSGTLAVNWSDGAFRKMTTRMTVMGDQGKLIVDAHELKLYAHHDWPELGIRIGWNVRYLTDLTPAVDFYLRGEEYSSETSYFFRNIRDRTLGGRCDFRTALLTDRVIELLQDDGVRS